MTPEQFVYWLSGYITGDPLSEYDEIREALTRVKIDTKTVLFFGGEDN